MSRRQKLRVAVAGATGLVGRALLRRLLDDPGFGTVHAVVRGAVRGDPLPSRARPLTVADYATLGQPGSAPLPALDCAISALGTTIKDAGSQAAFRAVDVDAVVAFARASKAAGAKRFGVVSALGADPRSRVFYNRCKGDMEAALRGLDFELLVIARPSLLLGHRAALGQKARRGEALAQAAMPLLAWAVPKRYAPISAETVAAAMLQALARGTPGTCVLESDDLQRMTRG